ncbi:MAG: DNA polymerase III subunit delta [Acidimicrobiales bacterium]
MTDPADPASPAADPASPAEPRVHLVKGDDPSLVSEAVTKLLSSLVGPEDPRLVVEEHGPEVPDTSAPDLIGPILDALRTAPFLTQRRVVVVRDAGRLRAEEVERLVAGFDHLAPSTYVVMVSGGGTLSTKLGTAVRRVGRVVDASTPTGRDRSGWVAQRTRHGPVRLDAAATALVDKHLGADLARLAGLLDSLAAAYGEGAKLGPRELEPFLGSSGGVMPWDLTDAIDRSDTAGALEALSRLLSAGQRHPLALLATLHRHYASMLRLDGAGVTSDAEAAGVLGVRSAWSAGKSLAAGRRLGSAGVARAIDLLARADLDLKGATALDGTVILEVLVARLSRLAPRSKSHRS